MRFLQLFAYGFLATSVTNAVSLPESNALSILAEHGGSAPRSEDIISQENALEKRKGGGGKGGGGGGGGKGGGSGGGGGGARTQPNSNLGGSTKLGSGPPRAYGGGFYGGGASVPYKAGQPSTKGLGAGAAIVPVAALAIFPGIWLWSVYPYHLNSYRFYNSSRHNRTENQNERRQEQQGQNETLPVTCLCEEFMSCGCEQNDDPSYINDLVGNGSYDALNKTLVNVADVNGTRTLVLNGSLPNGTTAPGGEDDAAGNLRIPHYTGYVAMVMTVVYMVAYL